VCQDFKNGVIRGWYLRLNGKSGKYLKEKNISNPSVSSKDIVFFSTITPSSDFCDFGGKTRVWVLNCATGGSILSNNCPGYEIDVDNFTFLLQLSGGNIEEIQATALTKEGGRATDYMSGIASEEGGLPMFPKSTLEGEILLWLEK
jgi:type IV pilus assembly protein PilY1